jgi:hypothetical protein
LAQSLPRFRQPGVLLARLNFEYRSRIAMTKTSLSVLIADVGDADVQHRGGAGAQGVPDSAARRSLADVLTALSAAV